ncbi:MAG: radical SAM protein [Desulfurococcaceae archaeon]
MFRGFRVVLTGDEGLVSTYHRTYLGFASGLPMDVFPRFLGRLLFPTRSGERGRMLTSQYGLCKVEASLLEAGFGRDDVAIVDPRRLDEAVGPDTRAVGIGVLDPLGINYGTMLLRAVLKLMGVEARLQSYMSWATMKLLGHPAIRRHRGRLKVIVGGQGVWEIVDSCLQDTLGIDVLVDGEGELVAPELFRAAVSGGDLPRLVSGPPAPVDRIPIIRTPSRGLVEISRGCGRGCRFCNPTLRAYRIIPIEKILREVAVNVAGGEAKISLHSEDFLRYGSTGLRPGGDKVLRLLEAVLRAPGVEEVSVDFATASTVMQDPGLVRRAGELLGLGEGNPSIIQMGIESASPRLLRQVAYGKPLPFKHEDWPRVVEEAISVLNDSGWWVCATMIVGLPGEGPEDVEANIELVERLRPYRAFVFPLPFIPSGSLRRARGLSSSEILPRGRNLELVAIAVYDPLQKIRGLSSFLTSRAPPVAGRALGALLYFASSVGLRRLQGGLAVAGAQLLRAAERAEELAEAAA